MRMGKYELNFYKFSINKHEKGLCDYSQRWIIIKWIVINIYERGKVVFKIENKNELT